MWSIKRTTVGLCGALVSAGALAEEGVLESLFGAPDEIVPTIDEEVGEEHIEFPAPDFSSCFPMLGTCAGAEVALSLVVQADGWPSDVELMSECELPREFVECTTHLAEAVHMAPTGGAVDYLLSLQGSDRAEVLPLEFVELSQQDEPAAESLEQEEVRTSLTNESAPDLSLPLLWRGWARSL
jgi:hypothetical protein